MKKLVLNLSEKRKANESRAKEELITNKELNTAKDLLKEYKEKIEAMDKAVKELSTEMKTVKAEMLSHEQEKVGTLSIQVEQYLLQIKALEEENVALRNKLEINESALNEGSSENKMLSKKYDALKSRLRRVLDGM